MVFNSLKAPEPLRGDSLLFTIRFTKIRGTYLIDLGRMKGWVETEAELNFVIKSDEKTMYVRTAQETIMIYSIRYSQTQ